MSAEQDFLPMLIMNGRVVNVFKAPDFTDKETGETKPGAHKVQLLVNMIQRNSEIKVEMVNLSTDMPDWFTTRSGQMVQVPVGAFPNGKDIVFYVNKAAFAKLEASRGRVGKGSAQ